jgi:DNA-binding GntR family transcriptional regulator
MAEFHLKFVESSGNRRLFESYQTIHSDINRYVFLTAFLQGAMEHRVQEHHTILELIKKCRYEKAKQLIRSHIRSSFAELKERMKNQERSILFKYSMTPPTKPVRSLLSEKKGRGRNYGSSGG